MLQSNRCSSGKSIKAIKQTFIWLQVILMHLLLIKSNLSFGSRKLLRLVSTFT